MNIYDIWGKIINYKTSGEQWAVYIEFQDISRSTGRGWLTFYFKSEKELFEDIAEEIKNFLKRFDNKISEIRISETFVSSPLKLMDGYVLEQTYDDFYCRYKLLFNQGELICNGITSKSGRSEEQGCIDDGWKHHDTLIEPYRADWDYIEKLTA